MVTRYPVPGRVKTRLVPALGAEGAAALQRALSGHIALELCALAATREAKVEVWHQGGTRAQMRRWLGRLPVYRPQPEGSLGARLCSVMRSAFKGGAERCVIVASDCPDMTADHIREALALLRRKGLALGPASDGGYWLVGLSAEGAAKALPRIFEGIEWGSERVLRQTIERASALGLEPVILDTLADIDRPDDLVHWERCRDAHASMLKVSMVVPTLNEASQIEEVVRDGLARGASEVIVADGGSEDGTRLRAAQAGARVVEAPRGRARQLNVGAAAARGDIFLFLHADTRLPPQAADLIREALETPQVVAGAFTYRAAGEGLTGRVMTAGGSLRHRLSGHPYGDQGLFLRRRVFRALGGYPDLPVMEDWELVRRLRRLGQVTILPEPAPSSAASFIDHGFWRASAVNVAVIVAYQLGVDASRLAEWRRSIARRPG